MHLRREKFENQHPHFIPVLEIEEKSTRIWQNLGSYKNWNIYKQSKE